MAGKGDNPRPVDKDKYESNYNRIFGTSKSRRSDPGSPKGFGRSKRRT